MLFGEESFRIIFIEISWSGYREGGGWFGCIELIRKCLNLGGIFKVCE